MCDKYSPDARNIPYVYSIFQQPWWLDAVAPGQWDEIIIKRGTNTLARLPYVIKRKYGLTLLTMPILTQTLGPWLAPSEAKYDKQLSQQKDLINILIRKLPNHDYFLQNIHYSITNWLPFYWQGFQQTTNYTYVIENLNDLDQVWSQFRENIRREIRKAQKKVVVRTDLDIEEFFNINVMTFQLKNKKPGYGLELLRRLNTACVKHSAGRTFFAEDEQGHIHAAIYLVWDENSAHYLMGGSYPEFRNSGATSLLMWEAIKFAATVTRKFDFEGSMIEGVERFFRAFGAIQKPYFELSGMSHRMKMVMAGRDLVNAVLKKSNCKTFS